MSNQVKVKPVGGRYFTTRDVAVIGTFSAVQFLFQFSTGSWLTFLPGAERTIVAFPVGFIAAITYVLTKKQGAVGVTIFITGLIQLLLSGFAPVIFEFIGGALGAEIVVFVAHKKRGTMGKPGIGLMAGSLMLGRGIGVTLGLLIFLPIAVLNNIATTSLLVVYVIFNGPLPFLIGIAGGLAAAQLVWNRKLGQRVTPPESLPSNSGTSRPPS